MDKIDEVLRKVSDIITSQIEPNPQDEISSELKQAENISISDTTIRPRKDIFLFDYDCVNEAVFLSFPVFFNLNKQNPKNAR